MCAAPHNRNVNTNSKGLILDRMTWSATHFNVPMVTADFLTALLRAPWQVTYTHTCTYTQTSLPGTRKRGTHTVALFLSPADSSSNEQACTQTHTNKSTLTQPKEQAQQGLYGVVLILAHVKISAQSPLLPLMYYYSQY